MEAVGEAAGVSTATVYAGFQSKGRLLSEVLRGAGGDAGTRRLAAEALRETNPVRRLRLAAQVVRAIIDQEAPIHRALWQAGSGSPDLLSGWQQIHEQQKGALGRVLEPLHRAGQLKPGLELQEAVDTFGALASLECHRLLVEERGWSPSRWEAWLGASAAALLLRSEWLESPV